jgi:hypothetical protein
MNLPEPPEHYKRAFDATLIAVRRWRRRHPTEQPTLPGPEDLSFAWPIKTGIEHYRLTNASLALARYVIDQVQDPTWMMFYSAWKIVYAS